MNTQKIKKYAFGIALALGFVVAPGFSSLSSVQAQGRWDRREDRWDRREDRWDRREGRWDRREGRWDRREDRWDRREDRWDDRNRDYQKGLRDGLRRGQEDLRDRRIADPNNSSHYRKGNDAYRAGFRRGYVQGYRSYRRW
jgi:hypothetical protein